MRRGMADAPSPHPGVPTGGAPPAAGPSVPPGELGRMLDQVPVGIVSADAEGRVRLLNRHAKAVLGVRARDVAGAPLTTLFPGAEDAVSSLVAVGAGDAPETRAVRIDRADGTRWLDLLATGFNAPGGDPVTVLLLQDVTARVGAELAVRESHQLLSAVTEGTNDILFVKDHAGRYLMINGAGATRVGRRPEDCIGAHVRDLYDAETAERILADDQAVMEAGETKEFEETIVPVGGERRVFLATKSPYRDADGQIVGVVGVARDITDRKRSEERLRMLAGAGEILSASLDYTAALEAVARAAVPAYADGCVVELVRSGGKRELLAVAGSEPDWEAAARDLWERRGPVAAPAGAGGSHFDPAVDPAAWARAAEDEQHRAALERVCPRSLITVALVAGGDPPLGTLTFMTGPSGRRLDRDDLRLAEELGRRAATAVAHARLHAERSHIAHTLRASLLPPRLPAVPGVRVASRFHAAGSAHQVGGDFYDLFPLADGRFVLVIGDVCGKGAEAAAVTALARYTIRGSTLREDSPARLLSLLSEALLRQDVGGFCSVLCARLEPADGGLGMVMASGGHPLPLLLRARGTAGEVGNLGTLLGVIEDPELPEFTHTLAPGETMLFYTDGVSEAGAPERLMEPAELVELALPWADWGAEAVAARLDAAALAAG
ncbi:MAG TPA: PAS domain-containing protein, partial [Solirubrobacteraceae bacterium]|nr:PAS domain-containing protein [Solirubrobacteraceae bacterium]